MNNNIGNETKKEKTVIIDFKKSVKLITKYPALYSTIRQLTPNNLKLKKFLTESRIIEYRLNLISLLKKYESIKLNKSCIFPNISDNKRLKYVFLFAHTKQGHCYWALLDKALINAGIYKYDKEYN